MDVQYAAGPIPTIDTFLSLICTCLHTQDFHHKDMGRNIIGSQNLRKFFVGCQFNYSSIIARLFLVDLYDYGFIDEI